ncbi:MAG TPA: ATP-grasp domain-containing protein [Pirellulales bacterium]|nr:ATP-grasp domain-containing protein [Pirellulales bacterium]
MSISLADQRETRRAIPRPPCQTVARPPVIVVGGGANALSIARSLGRRGIPVCAVNEPGAPVCRSRYARWLAEAGASPQSWEQWLTGPESDAWRGSVLLAASDAAIKLILDHRPLLAEKFLLDISNPQAQAAMLNKLGTYQAAVAAGVPTPRFWTAQTLAELENIRHELVFPLIVKPQLSHVFEERFGRKFLVAENHDELAQAFRTVCDAQIEMLLVERIGGPDSRLCSYYTYLDETGGPLFDFTKRIIRRWPAGMGAACYHITDHVPEIRELALRLFRHVGLQGLANVEFKLDDRDGRLKLIECNARFTAANGLLADCGFDLAWFVYERVLGRRPPRLANFRSGVRLWYPLEDFKAFRELHRNGELTLLAWLRSLGHRQTLPFFRWSDPGPSLIAESRRIRRACGRLFGSDTSRGP